MSKSAKKKPVRKKTAKKQTQSAGYSQTPLAKKLGIQPDFTLALADAPKQMELLLAPIPSGVKIRFNLRGRPDLSLVFCRNIAVLKKRVPLLWKLAFPDRAIWICWPKKSSSLFVDLTEDAIRKYVLKVGLVDIKVCAIDEDWSGLKLMVRKELR